ncbi:MAG: multiheme c-type cytochrome [Nitrospirota bacterium]
MEEPPAVSAAEDETAESQETEEPKVKGGDFTKAEVCGECHSTQYSQWLGSMHHYAQASLTNELINDFVQKQTGKTIGLFCIRCHTPIGTEMGEPYAMPNSERSEISLEGVTCDVCHSVSKEHGQVNTLFRLKPGNKVYGPHGKGGKDDPAPAKIDFHQAEQRDVFKKSEMCQHCHELYVPNGLRLQETYSEWKNSPWAKEGVPCQSCHMGPEPGKPSERPLGPIAEAGDLELPERPLSDHSFIGVDYHWTDDYPLPGGSKRTKERNAKLQAQLKEKREELMRNAAKLHVKAPATLAPGRKGVLSVRIENAFSGHHFPTGFPWRQVWVEVTYTDQHGKAFFQSGDLDSNGDIRNRFSPDVSAGLVKRDKHLVSLQTQILVRGFKGNDVEVMFPLAEEDAPAPTVFPAVTPQLVYNGAENARMVKRGIPARESRSYTYPIAVPRDLQGTVAYTVRLLYRNFPPYYFNYLTRYYPDLKDLLASMKSKLEIYEVDSVSGEIQMSEK